MNVDDSFVFFDDFNKLKYRFGGFETEYFNADEGGYLKNIRNVRNVIPER